MNKLTINLVVALRMGPTNMATAGGGEYYSYDITTNKNSTSNTAIFAATARIWLGLQMLLELIGVCQSQVVCARVK